MTIVEHDIDKLFLEEDYNTGYINADENKHELSSDDYPYKISLRRSDFSDEKNVSKFIKNCEILVRRSIEYKEWTSYLREVLGQYVCAVSGEYNNETTVDIHHHPMTLYDIIKGVVYQRLDSNKSFCTFDISCDVIELHFKNQVGYVPIVSSLHEKYHNGYLDIPIEFVVGDYKEWLSKYGTYLEEDDLKKIYSKISLNKEKCGWDKYTWGKDSYKGD